MDPVAARTTPDPSSLARALSAWLLVCWAGCGSADAGTPAPTHTSDAGVSADDAGPAHLDAQVNDAAGAPPRDAAGPIGSSPGTRDAEATIAVCGAQADSRCADDAGLADAGGDAPVSCAGDAGHGCGDVSCDVRNVMCKRAPPKCAGGDVPSVVDTCYGDCVPLEQCVCHAAEECPMPEQYICHMSAAHCGPYVN